MKEIRPAMMLAHSASDQNVFFTYVCLVDGEAFSSETRSTNITRSRTIIERGNEQTEHDMPIQAERTRALHELVVCKKRENDNHSTTTSHDKAIKFGGIESKEPKVSHEPKTTSSTEGSDLTDNDEVAYKDPKLLQLTRMKWLCEDPKESDSSSATSITPPKSDSSSCSCDSEISSNFSSNELEDKHLSTILRLDREHNLFGLSSITITTPPQSKKLRKDDDKPAFPQTTIVQICCETKCGGNCPAGCCRHRSHTALPCSLATTCYTCCKPSGTTVASSKTSITYGSFKARRRKGPCSKCPRGNCNCVVQKTVSPRTKAAVPKCPMKCSECFGLEITLKKKLQSALSFQATLSPRGSCILVKPLAARKCTHCPPCAPPSAQFPFLTPCYWPARPNTSCSEPKRCFHNPPCPYVTTKKKKCVPRGTETCVKVGTCKDKCPSAFCPGKNKALVEEILKNGVPNTSGATHDPMHDMYPPGTLHTPTPGAHPPCPGAQPTTTAKTT